MSVVIEFTQTTNVFNTLTIEGDALTALLDEHRIGESGESLDERMWTANAFSSANAAFWTALAAVDGVEESDREVDFTLDEVCDEDAEDDEEDDEDEDDSDEDDEEDETSDLSELLVDA